MPDLNTAAQKALDRFSEALTYIGSESFSPSMLAECRGSVEELRAALSSRAGDGKSAPFGWALVCNDGTTGDFRPRVTNFFGAIQEREAFTAEDAARRDADWPGLAPHRIVVLYSPAPAPAESPCQFAIDGGGNLYRRYREPVCAGCVPVMKLTDKWESARVADFNAGWNACREATLANFPAPVTGSTPNVVASTLEDRDAAVRMWHKHCDPFKSWMGETPPSPVIDAMLAFAKGGAA